MGILEKMSRLFLLARGRLRRYRGVVTVAMCAVAFATTYALILPALTLDENTAADDPAISLSASSENSAEADGAASAGGEAEDADAAEGAAGDAGTAADAGAAGTSAAADGTTTLSYEGDGYKVEATAGADAALPEGAALAVTEITKTGNAEAYENFETQTLALLQSEDENVAALSQARFFDISFVDGAGEEVEPSAEVQVKVSYDDATAVDDSSKVRVVHFADSGEASVIDAGNTTVTATQGELKDVEFQTASFSVYAITETSTVPADKTKQHRRTYTFQNDNGSAYTFNLGPSSSGGGSTSSITTSTQIVKNGDQLKDVGIPSAQLSDNQGKEFLGWGVVSGTGTDESVDTSNLIKLPTTVSGIGSADESVTLRAVFSTAATLTFYGDSEGTTVIQQERVAQGSTVDLSNYHATAEIPGSGSQATQYFIGWNTTKDATEALASSSYTATGDTSFYPVYREGYWLYFNGNDSDSDSTTKASFSDSIFVAGGQTSDYTQPSPTRAGYQFDGWYTDAACADDTAFTWGSTLSSATVLYAKWTPMTTNYTVVFWLENANDDNYSYAGSATKEGTSAQTTSYSVETGDLPEAISSDLSYLTLNTTDHAITQQLIKGDGSTIVNVYYDRNNYTLRFYYAYTNASGQAYVIEETTPFSKADASTTSDEAALALELHDRGHNSTYWDAVSTLPTPQGYAQTGTTTVTYNEAEYTFYYFDIIAKYGQNITRSWPSQPFGDYSTGVTKKGSEMRFVSWATRNGSGYYSSHDNKNIKGPYSVLDSSLIINPANSLAQSFLAYWFTPSTYNYKIYYSLLDGETADYTYEGVGYKLEAELDIASAAGLSAQNNLSFSGVDAVNSTPIETSGYDATFLYTRHKHTITFMTTTGDQIAKDENIPYGENLANTNAVNQQQEAGENAAPAHYNFVGWTTDPSGQGELFQFTGTMPDNDLILYAKYEADTVTVTFDPNGGTIPEQNASTSLVDTVYRNEAVSNETASIVQRTTYTDAQGNRYTLAGWYRVNADGTETYYNFGDKVTENITLKAHWYRSGEFNVRYVDGDGTVSNDAHVDSVAYADQSSVRVSSWPTGWKLPSGKVFAGWQLTVGSGATATTRTCLPGESFTMNANQAVEDTDGKSYITLTATYTQLGTTYLAYDANGGSGALVDPSGIASNEVVNIELNSTVKLSSGEGFTREGYVLAYWNTKADGTGTTWQLGDTVGLDDASGNRLYAIWAPVQKLKKVSSVAGEGGSYPVLSGATFKLTKAGSDGSTYSNVTASDFYGTVTVGGDGYTVTTGSDGTVTLGALKAGSYKLTETQAPAGYNIIANKEFAFTVDGKGLVTYTSSGTSDPVSYADGSDTTSPFTFTVKDTPGEALPSTGGPGTEPYTLAGVAAIALAGAGLIARRRRAER